MTIHHGTSGKIIIDGKEYPFGSVSFDEDNTSLTPEPNRVAPSKLEFTISGDFELIGRWNKILAGPGLCYYWAKRYTYLVGEN